jgi:hypothetical protein
VHFAEAKAGCCAAGATEARRASPGVSRARSNRAPASGFVVAPESLRDLTKRMAPDGRLTWDVPVGRWRILRIGYTSNGHYVAPATEEGRGLECDKLDPAIVRFHLDRYVGKLLERAGPAAGTTFAAVEIDSWECGIQNWTAGLEADPPSGWLLRSAAGMRRCRGLDRRRCGSDRPRHLGLRRFSPTSSPSVSRRGAKYLAEGRHLCGESTGRQQYLYDVPTSATATDHGQFSGSTAARGRGVRVDNKVASPSPTSAAWRGRVESTRQPRRGALAEPSVQPKARGTAPLRRRDQLSSTLRAQPTRVGPRCHVLLGA